MDSAIHLFVQPATGFTKVGILIQYLKGKKFNVKIDLLRPGHGQTRMRVDESVDARVCTGVLSTLCAGQTRMRVDKSA